MTDEIRKRLPGLGTTNGLAEGALAQVKYFSVYINWTWYALEYDGVDLFFGYVIGFEREWGYFTLSELDSACVMGDVPAVERDLFFEPQALSELL